MNLISLVNRLLPECSYKFFVPIVFGLLLYAQKSDSSENYQVDYVEGEVRAVEELSFCDESLIKERGLTKRLLFISTLDGGVTALDLTKNGEALWNIPTGELLSSSIHQMEMTNQGKSVRMIPSLNGGIYKFDGESVEAIPVNAEDLLKSSFKFKDDIVVSGSQEVKTYGVNCRTGQIVYERPIGGSGGSTKKKSNETDKNSNNNNDSDRRTTSDLVLDDILVVRRFSQTVRANEPRSGEERWNFSIGHHEMQVDLSDNCKNKEKDRIDEMIRDTEIRVIVPEGIICGYSKKNPSVILWKQKFNTPIVSVFRSDENSQLHSVDLFANARWLWEEHGNQYFVKASGNSELSPALYLGVFNQQFYIQESDMMKSNLNNLKRLDENLVRDEKLPKLPFKPVPASNNALIDFVSKFDSKMPNKNEENEHEKNSKQLMTIDDQLITAQSVFLAPSHAEGRGFYLFSSKDINETTQCKKTKSTNQNPQDFDNITFQNEKIHPVRLSLWFYWKEILVIALSTALIINIMLRNQNRRGEREVVFVPIAKEAIEYDDESEDLKKKQLEIEMLRNEAQAKLRSLSESGEENYRSRFLEDFDLVRCLGKGGFGVVFEARNKLDDCTYAIKRILLPSKQESRERVLREVKTLANCEHNNIVRYFHAWVEQPPKGWQELKDKELFTRDLISTSITIDSPSPTDESKAFSTYTDNKIKMTSYDCISNVNNNNNKIKVDNSNWLLNIQNKSFPEFSENKLLDETELDDSCIEFKADISDETDIKNNITNTGLTDDESFAIEFRETTRTISLSGVDDCGGADKNHVISIFDETSASQSNPNDHKKTHRRNLSLDLKSNANDLLPKRINASDAAPSKIYLFIQMQLCMKSSLKDWLKETDLKARNGETVHIWHQIIDAVHYVHLKGLIHRDLKPSNIFFALDGKIKIGDFGLVTDMAEIPIDPLTSSSSNSNSSSNFEMDFVYIGSSKKHTQRVGTSLYMSPEQTKGGAYNYKVDIYSLGLIFFELLNFFYTETERYKVLQDIKNQKYPEAFVNEFKSEFELLKLMLAKCPDERPTTYGIRARPPLSKSDNEVSSVEWHFELPTRRRDSFRSINNLSVK